MLAKIKFPILEWIYLKLFHTLDGVVIWCRICGTIIHFTISYQLYRLLKYMNLSKEYSLYLSILYFNLLPKNFIIPDYSNMFIWSLTIILIHLFRLEKDKPLLHAAICGGWMSVMVLAYPSSALFFPIIFVYLFRRKSNGKILSLIFTMICFFSGLLYLFNLIHVNGSASALLSNIRYLSEGQTSYTEADPVLKLFHYLKESAECILICFFYMLCALMIMLYRKIKDKPLSKTQFLYLILFFGGVHHIAHWLFMLTPYEEAKNYAIHIFILISAFFYTKKAEKNSTKTAFLWIGFSLISLICVLILTDQTVFSSSKYLTPGVVMGLFLLLTYSQEEDFYTYQKFSRKLLVFLCLTAVFVKGWCYPANGGAMMNITDIRGIIKNGPGKGIFTEYMTSFIAQNTYNEFQEYVTPGCSLLIVDDSPIAYMYQNIEISSYTTICAPQYNEFLLKYWELHPEKFPDVIAVTCWYGDLRWEQDSWIMHWIENDYHPLKTIDGKYYRYYFR